MFMDVLRATPGSPSGCIDHAGLGQKLVGFWVTGGWRRAAFVRSAGGAIPARRQPFYPPCAVRASVAAWPHQKPHWLPPHQRTIKCARAGQCRCKTESSRRPAVSSRSV